MVRFSLLQVYEADYTPMGFRSSYFVTKNSENMNRISSGLGYNEHDRY